MRGWLDFQLSANELHFTSLLLSVPLDSRQGRAQEPRGGRRRGLRGGGDHWTGWGHALGWTGPGNFRLYVSALQDGRGLELEFELSGGWGVGGVSGGIGVWGFGGPPATAGSLLVSHGQKKQSWTLPGYVSAALQSSTIKTGTQK